jgi:hypothetical protein
MRKEWLIYGGMWTAAILAMVAINFSQETGRPTSVSAAGDGAPVRSAQEGPAGLPPREAIARARPAARRDLVTWLLTESSPG